MHLWSGDGDSDLTITSASTSAVDINLGDADDLDSGRVRYNNTNNTLSFRTNGSDRVYIKNDGDVGIGSALPQVQFEVYGTSPIVRSKHSTSQAYTQINHDGTVGYLDWSSGSLLFRGASNTERLRIASDGVITGRGELRLTEGTSTVSNGDEIGSLMFIYPSNDNKNAKIVALQNAGTSGADLAFFTRTQADPTNADGGEERLRITSTGEVGIGTDDPSRILHVSSSNDQYIRVTSTNSANAGIEFGDSADKGKANIVYANSDDSMFFTVNGSEKVRITSTGNVGINSTVPRSKLHVASGTSGYNTGNPTGIGAGAIASIESNGNVGLQFLSGNSHNNYIYFGDTNSATTGSIQYSHSANALIFNVNGGTERLRITSNGLVGIGTTIAQLSSSERLSVNQALTVFRLDSATTGPLYLRNGNFSDTNNPYLVLQDTFGNRGGVGIANNDSAMFIHGQNGIRFRYSGTSPGTTEAMRISNTGNVGVNTDNPGLQALEIW